VKELGVKASQIILQASDPLFVLTELSQNFPSRTRSLSQSVLNTTVDEALAANQQILPAGRNLMVLNGVILELDGIDLYELLDRIRSEVCTTLVRHVSACILLFSQSCCPRSSWLGLRSLAAPTVHQCCVCNKFPHHFMVSSVVAVRHGWHGHVASIRSMCCTRRWWYCCPGPSF
jgi:hypothetical protein